MNSPKIPLTVWTNTPSFHQADLFRALVATGDVDLKVIFSYPVPESRIALGWSSDFVGYTNITLSDKHAIHQALKLAWGERNRIHIVGGLWGEPTIMAALVALRVTQARLLIYSEAPDPLIHRSQLKTLSKSLFARLVVRKNSGMLAISKMAVDHSLHLGFDQRFVYEFGYFLGRYKSPTVIPSISTVNLLFVGQLIHRKGVDLLIQAVADLLGGYPNLTLTLVGDGPDREQFKNMAKPFPTQINFVGVIPSHEIRHYLRHFHALVLPSRHDGWGVVVNEALSVGVPVIVSDKCGAADLVNEWENGFVFVSDDIESLRSCLKNLLTLNYAEYNAMRHTARDTGEKVSTETIAPYLLQCLHHMLGNTNIKPIPPWKDK